MDNYAEKLLKKLNCKICFFWSIRENFPYLQYGGVSLCPLCLVHGDSQEHVLECPVLGPAPLGVNYEHIRGNIEQQKRLVVEYVARLQWREEHLEDNED